MDIDLAIVNEDAGQFDVFLYALCSGFAVNSFEVLVGYTAFQRKWIESNKEDIWGLGTRSEKYRLKTDNNTSVGIKKI